MQASHLTLRGLLIVDPQSTRTPEPGCGDGRLSMASLCRGSIDCQYLRHFAGLDPCCSVASTRSRERCWAIDLGLDTFGKHVSGLLYVRCCHLSERRHCRSDVVCQRRKHLDRSIESFVKVRATKHPLTYEIECEGFDGGPSDLQHIEHHAVTVCAIEMNDPQGKIDTDCGAENSNLDLGQAIPKV